MPPELSYEEQRARNIADNEALLKSLGLDVPVIPKPVIPKPPKPQVKPRPERTVEADAYVDKDDGDSDDDDYAPKPTRSGRQPRRSGREVRAVDRLGSDEDHRQRKAERLGVRTQDPKQFGHIPGVEVGTCWPTRIQCSTAAIHAPTVAGISGNPEVGAWSVALSGGYSDDVDLGDAFTYTGSGGRDLKGTRQNPKNLRTAPQTFDQSFDNNNNASLKKSAETKNPVRVIRGFKLDSVYAPVEGYRYDGLYIVERAWMAPGLTNGLKVCKYAFKRMAGQPPLPRNDKAVETEEDEEDMDLEYEEGSPPSKPLSRRSSRLSNGSEPAVEPLSRRSSRLSNGGPPDGNRSARSAIEPLSRRSSCLLNGGAEASPAHASRPRRARISHIEIPSLRSVYGKRQLPAEDDAEAPVPAKRARAEPKTTATQGSKINGKGKETTVTTGARRPSARTLPPPLRRQYRLMWGSCRVCTFSTVPNTQIASPDSHTPYAC